MLCHAMLYDPGENGKVSCRLCSHRCRIAQGGYGFCGARENREGKLYTHAYGEVIAANADPVEKKPLYHFLPGTKSFSIAAPGCNFRCEFCQNWRISQISAKDREQAGCVPMSPEEIVKSAVEHNCRSISYTYTEPTIFFEYAFDTARLAHEQGLYNIFVSNGYMTEEAFSTIEPWLDACNIDLKSFRGDFYRKTCKARLEPVLDTIRRIGKSRTWIEVTTLIIPGLNDSEEELQDIAKFISGVDPDIPWHISRFFPAYKRTDLQPTPLDTIRQACEIGKSQGLHYIYPGNVPGESSDILCPNCSNVVIRRQVGHGIRESHVHESRCSFCGTDIQGVFLPQEE